MTEKIPAVLLNTNRIKKTITEGLFQLCRVKRKGRKPNQEKES